MILGLDTIDFIIIISNLILIMGIGLTFMRKGSKGIESFFLSGRSAAWWLIGTSMAATTFASDTPLAISETVRGIMGGFQQNWFWWSMVTGFMLHVFFFSRLWRRAKVLTDNEFLELRYDGKPAAFLRGFKAIYFALPINFIILGWVFNGMSTVLVYLLGPEVADAPYWFGLAAKHWISIFLAIIVTVYSVSSGLKGVLVTDLFQFGLAIGGAIMLLVFSISAVGGMKKGIDIISESTYYQIVLPYNAFPDAYQNPEQHTVYVYGDFARPLLENYKKGFQKESDFENERLVMTYDYNLHQWKTDVLFYAEHTKEYNYKFFIKPENRIIGPFKTRFEIGEDKKLTDMVPVIFSFQNLEDSISHIDGTIHGELTEYMDQDDHEIHFVATGNANHEYSAFFPLKRNMAQQIQEADKPVTVSCFISWNDMDARNDSMTFIPTQCHYKNIARNHQHPVYRLAGNPVMEKIHTLEMFTGPDFKAIKSFNDLLVHPFFITILQMLVLWWCSYSADGGGYMIQRMSSAKDEKNSLYATLWYNMMHFVVRTWPWLIVAVLSIIIFPNIRYTRTGYPDMIRYLLPVGLKGLMIASLLAAFMSTVATHLNWGTSYIINDIWKRFIIKNGSDTHYVFVARIVQLTITVLVIIVSYYVTSIFELWILIWMMTAGLGMVIILRWFWWRVNAWSEISALIFSTIIAVLTFKSELIGAIFGHPDKAISLFGTEEWLAHHVFATDTLLISHKIILIIPGSIIVWLTVTAFSKPVQFEHLKIFYKRVHPPGQWKPVKTALESEGLSFPTSSFRIALSAWISGTLMILLSLYGIGKFFMLDFIKGATALCLAIACAFFIASLIKKLDFN